MHTHTHTYTHIYTDTHLLLTDTSTHTDSTRSLLLDLTPTVPIYHDSVCESVCAVCVACVYVGCNQNNQLTYDFDDPGEFTQEKNLQLVEMLINLGILYRIYVHMCISECI